MKKLVIFAIIGAAMVACTPVRAVGNVAVGTGQLALGAVDVVL
ncbi:hypothetical protein FHS72_003683 [Loktanella ponticola]|uniref:Uncharacterized protein n=1 Tax=Yoonia ponticola TaxID=1524255 RepID=A0A7W9BP09_9RHOB|nr:hypothetical protein [Yoonia ponticola]MBB5724033.1 hypothetical protein [Yoonia ponticola]